MAFNSHTHVIKKDGTLWGWGANLYYSLGNNGTVPSAVPIKIGTGTDWSIISSGTDFSVGIKKDGTLWSAGLDTGGRTGQGTVSGSTTKVFTKIGLDNDWKYVSCGSTHALAIKEDGRLFAFGEGATYKTGLGHVNDVTVPTLVGVDTDWKFVSAGGDFSLGIKEDGTLWGWGGGTSGQTGINNTFSTPVKVSVDTDWVYISTGNGNSYALKENGTLWVTGSNVYGALGLGHTTTVKGWTQIPSSTWKAVSAGQNNAYAIKDDGTLWAVGRGVYFSNGQETALDTLVFKQIGYETYWEKLKGGVQWCLAMSSDKFLFSFGYNGSGRLGNGNSTNQFLVQATNLGDIETIPDSLRLRRFPVLQPATIIADCLAYPDIKRIVVGGRFPEKTHVRFLVSADNVVWKAYNITTSLWEEVPLAESSTKGMTKAVFEGLDVAKLQWISNIAFKVAITVWTEAGNLTPVIRGLDVVVGTGVQTASIQSLGVNYNLLKPEIPKYYVSRNDGADWQEIELDTLVKLDGQPEGKQLRVRSVLSNGQELHGLSYSWI